MKSNKKHKGLIAVLVLLLLLFAAIFGFVWHKLNLLQYDGGSGTTESTQESQLNVQEPGKTEPTETEAPVVRPEDITHLKPAPQPPKTPKLEIKHSDDVLNVLLLGTDERSKNFSANARSDSMMLLSVNRKKHTAKLVSLERGMGVPVLEGRYKGQYDWLTHIFRYGGADLVMKTVRECFRVDVERYVRVNFNTMTQGIDAIGGVDISMTQAEADCLNQKRFRGDGPLLTAGLNHLDGKMALNYARTRYIDSDWQRIRRQRSVVQAAVNTTRNLNILELNELANKVLPLVMTNFTKSEIAELMLLAPSFRGCQLEQMTIPKKGTYGGMTGMGGRSLYAVNFDKNAKILREFLYAE